MHRLPASLGCYDGHEQEPIELVNGWMWHKKYYATLESLNCEYYQEIHIGKSSCGWRFSLCIYPTENPRFKNDEHYHELYLDEPIESLDDWIKLFNDKHNKIYDEYDEEVTPEDMINIISKRKGHDDLKDGWQKLYVGTEFESKEMYLAINGLLVHDRSRDMYAHLIPKDRVTIMPEDCTYDLILSGNDVESGEIFS